MKKFLLLSLLLIVWMPAQAQFNYDHLQVLNPQRNWDARNGTIEEAVVSVRPKGIYAEVGVYLTFSDKGAGFANGEQLEVQFFFSLPAGAMITDSWLWVGEEIVRAELIDRWTATEVYEGIVNRRQDPSLLIKHDQERYELRVFPLTGGSTRKVKITYLIPMDWTAARVNVPLPFHWIGTSVNPIDTISLLAWPDETWKNPFITEDPNIPVQHFVDEEFGEYNRIDIPNNTLSGPRSLSFDAPLNDGVFISQLENEEDGFYQIAFLPSAFTDVQSEEKKVAVLFDYDITKTTLTGSEVLSVAREALKAALQPSDRFNLIFTQLDTRRASDAWLPATPAAIDSAFAALSGSSLAFYTNLPTLLSDGVSFLEENGGDGSLLVVSSSDALSNADAANQLIDDLNDLRDPIPTLLIADIANTGLNSANIDSRFYEGNGYLYTNLARLSGGQYASIRSGVSYAGLLSDMLSGVLGSVQAFDLYTTLETGFTYGRFTSIDGTDTVPLGKAVTQVGKFLGGFPFVIEASGIYNETPLTDRLTYPVEEIVLSDSTVIAYWTGKHIEALEQSFQDNDTIAEIIEFSLRARVISLYTAFLALEPGVNETEPCGEECEDETDVLTSDEDEALPSGSDVYLEVYPNPFTSRATVKITFPETVDLSMITFEVFNAMGQRVKTLTPESSSGRVVEVVWDGTTEAGAPASSGIYFFVMTSPFGRHTMKLVLVR